MSNEPNNLGRRSFLNQVGLNFGALAASAMLGDELAASELKNSLPHFAPKAKRVIFLTQSGGPSQIELFDDKPDLHKLAGTPLPDSVRQGQRLTGMTKGKPQLILPPSPAAVAAEMAYDAGTASAAERQNGAVLSQPLQSDETPILNEFGDDYKAIPEQQISAVDRIKSLRYQTSGDQAFRQHDYESAEALYRAASDTAVVRRAPWLRLAWAQVALRKNSEALASLKTALHLRDDPTSSWVDGKDLFGVGFETNMVKLNEDLWKWLQAKPNSTDRLLLVAAFQQLRGYAGISQELTDAASRNGLDRELISALREISAANNVAGAGPNQPPVDQAPQPIDIPLPPVSSVDDGGIRMIGGRVISPAETSDAAIGAPEPVLASEEFPATQSEASSKNLGPLPQVSPGLPLVIPPMNSPTP